MHLNPRLWRSRLSAPIALMTGLLAVLIGATGPIGLAGTDATPPQFTHGPVVKTAVGQRLPWRSTMVVNRTARFVMKWNAIDPESDVCSNRLYLGDFQQEEPLTELPARPYSESANGRFVVRQQGLVGGSISSLDITGGHAVALNCLGDWSSQWTPVMPKLVDEAGMYFSQDGDHVAWATDVSRTGNWFEQAADSAIDDSHLVTPDDGASISYHPVNPRRETLAVIADVGPNMGSVEVWVNSSLVKVIDLSATSARSRVVVGNVRLPGTTDEGVSLVARNDEGGQGASGTRVVLDGFVLTYAF